MDVRADDEHLQLADLAWRIGSAAGDGPPPAAAAPLDPDGWRALQQAGLVTLLLPAAMGGGGSPVDAVFVVEQLARTLAPLPYVGTVLATRLLVDAGAEVADASEPRALALDEALAPAAGPLVWDAAGAVQAVGLTDHDVTVAPVGPQSPSSADLTRRVARTAGAAERVGRLHEPHRDRWSALALTLLSADLLGTMQGALDAAVDHARQRDQFGRPIGSFQAVQQLCADQLVQVEAARSAVWHAAWAADEVDPAEALTAARVAKAWTSRAGREVCEAAIQVWGGIGMTWECRAHAFLRRALLAGRTLGGPRQQLAHLATTRLGAAA